MSKKGLAAGLAAFIVVFYFAIILYVLFAIQHINTLDNCVAALIFEFIGFVALGYFVMNGVWLKHIKIGYFVPLVLMTILYTIALDIVNIACVVSVKTTTFVLINLIILFIYCLISIPMYVMGMKYKENNEEEI